jgi:hypothetical protein
MSNRMSFSSLLNVLSPIVIFGILGIFVGKTMNLTERVEKQEQLIINLSKAALNQDDLNKVQTDYNREVKVILSEIVELLKEVEHE